MSEINNKRLARKEALAQLRRQRTEGAKGNCHSLDFYLVISQAELNEQQEP